MVTCSYIWTVIKNICVYLQNQNHHDKENKVTFRNTIRHEKIVIDLADLNIGDSVHGSDLVLPDGVSLGLHQAELAFATIGGKMPEEADAKKPAAAADAAAAAPAKK